MRKLSFKNILILFHVFFAVFGFFTYLFNYFSVENLLVQRTLNRQLIIAKSGSLAAENLLKSVENQLSSFIFSFTKVPPNAQIDERAIRDEFYAYMQRSQLPVNGIALYDEKGKLIILENRQHNHNGEGQDFSQTTYIKWSTDKINRKKILITGPYIGTTGASAGQMIIIVTQPIYFGDTFKGTLAIRLLVENFRDAYVTPLLSGTKDVSFIIDSHGVLLVGQKSLLNKNLFAYAGQKKWNGYLDFTTKLNSATKPQSESQMYQWIFQNPGQQPETELVAVSKIDLPDPNPDLYLIVSTAKDDLSLLLQPLQSYGFIWLGIGVLATVIGGLIAIFL